MSALMISPATKNQVEKILIAGSNGFGYDRASCQPIIDKYERLHKGNFINSLTRKVNDGSETLQSFLKDRREYLELLCSVSISSFTRFCRTGFLTSTSDYVLFFRMERSYRSGTGTDVMRKKV